MRQEKEFNKPEILKTANKIFKKGTCDNCLGRQFAMISTGLANKERGQILRKLLNAGPEKKECKICNNLFRNLEKFVPDVKEKLKGIDFKTFSVGSRINENLMEREEKLWKSVGIKYCEPLKSELNREFGKLLEKRMKKTADKLNPDINILIDLESKKIEIKINPVFFYGKYKKLVRGLPQTKWDKYPETVEDIIACPLMKKTCGKGHSMHACGREDIDARCLDWRPFVFEITEPKKRKIDLKKIESEIKKTKKVEIKDLRLSNKKEVIRIKALRPDKSYRVLVDFEKPVKNIEKLKKLCTLIKQKTPKRVLHRRADLLRNRKVKSIGWKKINNKRYEIEIKGEAGLYIKELVTGDNERTKPSVSEILNNPAKVELLDVTKIWLSNKRQ